MDGVGLFLFFSILVIGGTIALACYSEKKKKENALFVKLERMGDLSRYTYSQITANIGYPNSVENVGYHKFCTWQECATSGWTWGVLSVSTVTLEFDENDRCLRIVRTSCVWFLKFIFR